MKAIINSLTLALVEYGMDVAAAKTFATNFVTENADLFTAQDQLPRTAQPPANQVALWPRPIDLREPGQPLDEDAPIERAVVHKVPVVGPDGLTAKQRAAIGGVGLCANCQQPNNGHLPGCAKESGEDKRAVTKDPLPPAV